LDNISLGAYRRPGDVRSTEEGPKPSQYLFHSERLGDVVVGSRIQPRHSVVYLDMRGDNQDGNPVLFRPEYLAHLKAGEPRHCDIQKDRMWALALGKRKCGHAVGGLQYLIALQ